MKPLPICWRSHLPLALLLAAAAPCAYGSIRGPYTNDTSTVVLLHLDETAAEGIATNTIGGTNFIATANPAAATPRNPTPGILGASGASGVGYTFGNCANLTYSNSVGLYIDANQNGVADLDVSGSALGADAVPMSWFCGPAGEFTIEALIKLPSLTGANREIVAMDSSGSPRPFQFRVTSSGLLEFNNIGTSGANPKVAIPTTGPEAFVANEWFHVALTYDGAGTMNFYWTRLDNTRTGATLLLSTNGIPTLNETGTAVLTVGNENRNTSGEGLTGFIDEVRLSNVSRGPTDLLFDTKAPPIVPSISPQPTDQFLGVGETLVIQSHASGSPVLKYVWQKDSGTGFTDIPGEVGDAFSTPVTFATEGNYRYIVSNSYGSATSIVARVTVGAVLSGLFRTGFDDAYVQLDDGLVDPHYTIWSSADPGALGPSTIACPVTDTSYNANDAESRWIDPFASLGGTRGVYTYRATFLVDSALPESVSLSASILAAGPTTILLNGQSTGIANLTPAFPGPFRNLFSFTLTTGFKSGLNTLDFVVDNSTTAVNPIYGNALRVTSIRGVGAALAAGLPTILSQPQSQSVRDGSMVSFSTVATGRPPLRYQWYGDDAALAGATNRTLTYNPVATGAQPTRFKVVVGNDSGPVTSAVATLTLVPTNQPVVTTNLTVTGIRGVPIPIPMSAILQNSSDPDGDPIQFGLYDNFGSNNVDQATITLTGAVFVYSNSPSFVGNDSFNVTLTDAYGGDAINAVQVKVVSDVSLKIAPAANQTVRVSWPAAATAQGFVLRSADSLADAMTNAVPGLVWSEGNESSMYLTPATLTKFFRLVYP